MTVISFANPKGGSGKSTACLIAALELARRDYSVSVIETDPLKWISRWADLEPEACPNLIVGSVLDPDSLPAAIHLERQNNDFVLLDTEGSKNIAVAHAISMADLVVIPIQPSALDSEAAEEAIKLLIAQEIATSRRIPFVVLFNRINAAIETRSARAIRSELAEAEYPFLPVGLVERSAFRELFAYGGDLADLPSSEINGIVNARSNASAYIEAILRQLEKKKADAA